MKSFASESISWNVELDVTFYQSQEDPAEYELDEIPTVKQTMLFVEMSYYFQTPRCGGRGTERLTPPHGPRTFSGLSAAPVAHADRS